MACSPVTHITFKNNPVAFDVPKEEHLTDRGKSPAQGNTAYIPYPAGSTPAQCGSDMGGSNAVYPGTPFDKPAPSGPEPAVLTAREELNQLIEQTETRLGQLYALRQALPLLRNFSGIKSLVLDELYGRR